MATIAEQVKELIIDKLGKDPAEVTESANFLIDLGADSIENVELIMAFEEKFGIQLGEEESEGIKTVGDAIALVEKKVAEKE